jgi:hypothetical protein
MLAPSNNQKLSLVAKIYPLIAINNDPKASTRLRPTWSAYKQVDKLIITSPTRVDDMKTPILFGEFPRAERKRDKTRVDPPKANMRTILCKNKYITSRGIERKLSRPVIKKTLCRSLVRHGTGSFMAPLVRKELVWCSSASKHHRAKVENEDKNSVLQ